MERPIDLASHRRALRATSRSSHATRPGEPLQLPQTYISGELDALVLACLRKD
jgi:hypothetical protein